MNTILSRPTTAGSCKTERLAELWVQIMEHTSLQMGDFKRWLLAAPLLYAASTIAARPITPTIEVQCILVEKARIAGRSLVREGHFGRANHGHQIVIGNKSVLAIRIYDDPDRGPDSQIFKKATLELEAPPIVPVGGDVFVNVIRSYYSEGASGWVADGGYWWAKNPFSRIRFRREQNRLVASLNATFPAINAEKNFRPKNSRLPVDVTCPVRELSVIKLTPWTGREGTSFHSFYTQGTPP